jgi:hypothetical protein
MKKGSNMASKENALRRILGSQTSDKAVLAQAVLEVLKTASDRDEMIDLFVIAITERDSVDSVEVELKNVGMPSEQWNDLAQTMGKVVHEYLVRTFYRTTDARGFADHALRLLDLFELDSEKTYALAMTLHSPFVPYRQLPGKVVAMSSEKFIQLLKANQDKVDLVEYAASLPVHKTTDVASLVLPILDSVDSQEARIALIAWLIGTIQRRLTQ